MGKQEKLLSQILKGTSDANISFEGLCNLLQNIGFAMRIRGVIIYSQKIMLKKY